MQWRDPLLLQIIVVSFFRVILGSSNCSDQVPRWLQCTHLNVAAERNGATCTPRSNPECGGVIDGRTDTGSTERFIKITFARDFLVNKLVIQLGSPNPQISDICLNFSDSSLESITLTPNAVKEEITFTPRVVKWVQIFSTTAGGFREIEVYHDHCIRDRQCDLINLLPSNDSGPIALVDDTVMFSIQMAIPEPVNVRFTTKSHSDDGYIFKISTIYVKLFRVVSDAETLLQQRNFSDVMGVGWRTLWVNYRCTSVILGSGNDVILKFDDMVNHQIIHFIKFEKPLNRKTILLCNRRDKCHNDASYYWPLDKAIGEVLHDVQGRSDGKVKTTLIESDVWVSGPRWHSVSSAALNLFKSGPIALIQNLSSTCLGDIQQCYDGLTVAFWFQLTENIADSQWLLYSAKDFTDISITVQSNNITGAFFISGNTWSATFDVTLHQWHHVAFTWAKSNGFIAIVNFVHVKQGGVDSSLTSSSGDNPLTIGRGLTKSSLYMSHVVVYERFLSSSQIQRIGKCTNLVSDTDPESYGVITGIVPDDQFIASSSLNQQSGPHQGRARVSQPGLFSGSWIPNVQSKSQYLQVDLLQVRNISAIMTQGRNEWECNCGEWVTLYTLSYSLCGSIWSDYIANGSIKYFVGNHDGETIVSNFLCPDLTARVLRFHPFSWHNAIAMRIDVVASKNAVNYLGCFSSPSDMVLSNDTVVSKLTPERCVTACGKAGKRYAGITQGTQCHCSNDSPDVDKVTDDAACYYPCERDKALKCGSNLYFSVYYAPGQYDFPLALSVASASEAFERVKITVTPNYGSLVMLNFGDGTVIYTKNSSIEYVYTTLGLHEVYAETTIGYYGQCQKIYDVKTINVSLPVTGVKVQCPSVVEAWSSFECSLKVGTGSNMDMQFTTPLGEVVNGSMEDSTPQMVGYKTRLPSSEPKFNLSDANKTIILPNYYFGKTGRLVAVKSNTTRAGHIELQVLRPLCILPAENKYCFQNGSCTTKLPDCSLSNLGYQCSSAANVFCGQSIDCQMGLLTCPANQTSNSTLSTHYEVIYTSTLYLPEGFHITIVNQPGFMVRTADIVSIGAIQNIAAGIISTESAGNAFIFYQHHLSVGEVVLGRNNAAFTKIHHTFHLVVVYLPPSEMVVSLGNYPVGHWKQQGSVAWRSIELNITACVSMKNITWEVPDFVPKNKTFNIVVPPHPGHNVTFGIQIMEENSSNVLYKKEEKEFFYSWTNVSKSLPLRLDRESQTTLLLTASNLLSSAMRKCQVEIMIPVEEVYLFNITLTSLGNDTEISWVVERGTNISYLVSFGDGNYIEGSFRELGILVGSYLHKYSREGNFTVNVTAYNFVSTETVTGVAVVIAPIVNVTCRVIHAARDIEVNETIQINATFPQGSNSMALVDFADSSKTTGVPTQTLICSDTCRPMYSLVVSHNYSTYGSYTANLTFINSVNKRTCLPNIFVHKPVYPLTGFNITCPLANLSTPTFCMLDVTGGNDFWCDWDFGANSQKGKSHYWNLTLPVANNYSDVGNFTIRTNCSNRLYNTTVIGNAIVQEPITGFVVTCPEAQSVDEALNLDVQVATGTGMNFEISLKHVYADNLTLRLTNFTDHKSPTFSISPQKFPVIGIYLLTVKVANLVTPQQIYTREIKVDKVIANLRLLNNDTFIPVNKTIKCEISIDAGTNITLDWDFEDGRRSVSLFTGDSLRLLGDFLEHLYTDHGAYLLNVTASNPVSKVTVTKYLYVQYIVKDIEITSDSPQEIPPGTVTFTVSVKPDTHPPTNATIDMDFGDSTNRMNIPLGEAQSINITNNYITPGMIRVNMTMRNDVSSVNLTHVVDVQRSIKDLQILAYHTDGDAGYGAPGGGPNRADFPMEYDVLLVANISDGTAVTYRWDFGDGTSVETKKINVLHRYLSPEGFAVTIEAKNSISDASVSRTIRIMKSIFNVSFENDSPTVHEFNTTLFITIGQRGTDSCFLVDLGNSTRILYKGFSDVSCDDELKKTNDVRVLPSLNFNITFEYWQKIDYAVNLTALNSVSRVTIHGWVVILHLPCDFPVVRIPDAGRSFGTRRKYFRADYVTIKSRCTINCLASRETSFHWELTRISSGADNGTTLRTDSFDKNQSVLIVPQRSLPYGTFMVRLNVSMVGLPLVHRHKNAYIEIMPSPLLAKIISGNAWSQSVYKKIVLDASHSHDPDYGSEDKHGLEYFWYCKTTTENYEFPSVPSKNFTNSNSTDSSGCFRNGTRLLPVSTDILEIQPNVLWVNTTYVFKFFVTKDSRMAMFFVHVSLTYEDPPTMSIRKPYDEFPGKENPSAKLSLEGVCKGCNQQDINSLTISWSLWVTGEGDGNAHSAIEMADHTVTDWTRVANLLAMTRAGIASEFLILRANSLESGVSYTARVQGRFGEGATGFAEYVFVTASPPTGGECHAIKGDDNGHEVLITLSCNGWTSSSGSTKLMYDYFYKTSPDGAEYLFQYTRDGTIGNIRLPLGLREYNYTLYLKAIISDELGSKSEAKFEYQSFPSEEDDSVLIEKLLEEMTINSTLRTLEMESYSQFTNQYIVEVASQLNAMSERAANLTGFKEASRNIRTRMSRVLSEITMDDIKTVRETANAVSKLATIPDECEVEAQLNLNKTLSNMVSLIIQQSAITDSTELWGTLNTVSEALGNMLGVVSHLMDGEYFAGNRTNASMTQENFDVLGKILMEKVIEYVRLLSDSYLGHTLPKEEPIQVRSPSLYFTLNRDFPAGFSGRTLHCGVGGVDLPDDFGELGILKDGNETALIVINALVTSTPFVPFVWSPSTSLVNSYVLSIEIRNYSTQEELKIENLTQPVDLWIRKRSESLKTSQGKVEYTKILRHRFEVKDNRSSITIEVDLLGEFTEQPSLVVYLRKGEEPTMDGHERDKIRVVPQLNSCVNASNEGAWDPKLLFFSNTEFNGTAAGEYFVIVEYNGTVNGARVAEEDRTVEYLFSTYTSECLYWNELNQTWVGDGCVVGPLSNSTHTQCLCTHMSSFASSFFVPPNKIDWRKVNLKELLKNPTVTIIVCCIFLLYFLLVVWARQKDKADLLLVGVTPLPTNDPRDLYGYEVIVFTGFDSSAGTTADVSIVLTGTFEQTQTRRLLDLEPARRKFQQGSVDNFLLTVPRPLGEILGIRIWHNNTGPDPSWFLSRVLVRDLQTDKVVWFVCDRWLAVEEDDGQIDRTLLPASKEELVRFSFLFSSEVRNNLSDGHLWYSVLYRPLGSSFTCVQRLSCCLSILTCSMLANAMFYKDGAEEESNAEVEVKIGPIRLSINQIGIGVMSSLVVLPVNFLIVNIFRKARPKDLPMLGTKPSNHQSNACEYSDFDSETCRSYDLVEKKKEDAENSETKKEEKGEKGKKVFTLPHCTIYIAYGLIFVASVTSAVFTIFYSLTFGEAKSQRWVSSMMISFWQDVIISQPLKVIIVAVLFALIIKDPDKAIQDDGKERRELGRDEEWIHDSYGNLQNGFDFRKCTEIPKPPGEGILHIARQRRTKQKQMKIILREIFLYFGFILVLSVVAYGSRDTQAYAVTKALTDIFPESKYTSLLPFDQRSEASKLWNWIENSFVPSLHPQYWYGPFIIKQEEQLWSEERMTFKTGRGGGRKIKTIVKGGGSYATDYAESFESLKSFPKTVTADRGMFYIVGVARLRQLRVKKDACTIPLHLLHIIKTCTSYYSWEDEEEGAFHPGWEPMKESDVEKLPNDHQSPWIWQSALALNGTPFWGIFASYWGGGFVYNLAPTRLTALKNIRDLHIDEWIDRYTRAVFAEFTVYNAHTNFFGVVTMLTEILPTGGYYHYPKVRSIRLYRYTGPEQMVIMVFEFIFFVSLCIYSYNEAKQLFVLGKSYFKDPWNYVEIIVIASSFSAIFLYLAELGFAKLAVKRMRANPDTFISFDYIIFLDEAYLGTLGMAVFCFFLKFLKLLRFNRRLSTLAQTIKVSSKPLLSFFVIFFLFFVAYVQVAFLVFGSTNEDYATFVVASETMLSMTLGGFDFLGLQNSNRLIGPIFFISYMLFMFLILVNVFLSIVNDAFAEVSSNVGNQTNDYEVLDYIMYCLKEQIGRLVIPPFKPLYKPTLTNFEKAVADIEDFAESITYTLDNISIEEQRQANWLEVDKISDKKKTLFRFLLHMDEDFDEDDIADAIPHMARFMSKYSLEQLQEIYQRNCERVMLSKFHLSSTSSLADSSYEGQYEDIDGFDEHVLRSWKSYGELSQADVGVPNRFRSLNSIAEENEPIDANHTYDSMAGSDEHGNCSRSSFDIDDKNPVAMIKSSSLSDINIEITSNTHL